MPGSNGGSTVIRVVLCDQIFAGKLIAESPDDLGNGSRIDGLDGIEANSVDTVVAKIHTSVVDKEILNFALPRSETFAPGRVMAVHMVDSTADSIITGHVAVVLPIAVVIC